MADKKLNELGTITSFDNAYVELSQNQYRISKTNLGKQLTDEVHLNFSKVSSGLDYIFGEKSNGTKVKISKADLANVIRNDASALSGALECNRALYDGCYIMYHRQAYDSSDGHPVAAQYADWPSLQSSGEKADGVLIVEGGRSLVVAPKEKICAWTAKTGTATETVDYTSENRIKMLNTWDGKDRTKKICTDSSSPFRDEKDEFRNYSFAPGYCYNYSPHINVVSYKQFEQGLGRGDYWLPCIAELMMIYTHKQKINAGLALITDADQLTNNWYWSSIEFNDSNAWYFALGNGIIYVYSKKTSGFLHARPVSEFKHHPSIF